MKFEIYGLNIRGNCDFVLPSRAVMCRSGSVEGLLSVEIVMWE